jgi:hypothetical protein
VRPLGRPPTPRARRASSPPAPHRYENGNHEYHDRHDEHHEYDEHHRRHDNGYHEYNEHHSYENGRYHYRHHDRHEHHGNDGHNRYDNGHYEHHGFVNRDDHRSEQYWSYRRIEHYSSIDQRSYQLGHRGRDSRHDPQRQGITKHRWPLLPRSGGRSSDFAHQRSGARAYVRAPAVALSIGAKGGGCQEKETCFLRWV